MLTMTTLVLADLCASQRAFLASLPVVRRLVPADGEPAMPSMGEPSATCSGSSPRDVPGSGSAHTAGGVSE